MYCFVLMSLFLNILGSKIKTLHYTSKGVGIQDDFKVYRSIGVPEIIIFYISDFHKYIKGIV